MYRVLKTVLNYTNGNIAEKYFIQHQVTTGFWVFKKTKWVTYAEHSDYNEFPIYFDSKENAVTYAKALELKPQVVCES